MNYPTGANREITSLKTVTEKDKYAADAIQLNPNIDGTLANEVSKKVNIINNAAAHNGIFRGINLLTKYTLAQILTKISNGDFEDLYIGDYFDITISTEYTSSEVVRCILADFDYYWNCGDVPFRQHHAVIVPKNAFAILAKMNETNTTEGGYYNSDMCQTIMSEYNIALNTVFGGHLLTRKELLTNAVNATTPSMGGAGLTGASSGWAWYDNAICLMSEIQVYGSKVWSSSGYDTGIANRQLALFRHDPSALVCKAGGVEDANASNRVWWWLRDVASASYFAIVGTLGDSSYYGASGSGGVRPLFLIG